MGADFYKEITGEIKKITKKRVSPTKQFHTPGCLVRHIPTGTVYYEVVLTPGALKKGRFSSDKPTIIEQEVELLFFEYFHGKEIRGENLKIGKKYQFYTGGKQISNWKEIID